MTDPLAQYLEYTIEIEDYGPAMNAMMKKGEGFQAQKEYYEIYDVPEGTILPDDVEPLGGKPC